MKLENIARKSLALGVIVAVNLGVVALAKYENKIRDYITMQREPIIVEVPITRTPNSSVSVIAKDVTQDSYEDLVVTIVEGRKTNVFTFYNDTKGSFSTTNHYE